MDFNMENFFGDERATIAMAAAASSSSVHQPPSEGGGGDSDHHSLRQAGVLEEPNKYVNCFSLIHHDLNVSTNSLQYSVVLDVLNSILLFVDPAGMKRSDSILHLKYRLMLSSNTEELRKSVLHMQLLLR